MKKKLTLKNKISVIIPAYNEAGVIGRLLISLKKQNYKNIEVIVIDDDSTDNTVDISKKYTTLVFFRKHAERSVQRNFGAKQAKGEYLLFLDADMELTPTILEECVEAINGKNIGAIAIPEKSIATNFWEKVKAFERSFYNEVEVHNEVGVHNESGDSATDAARFFTREAFDKTGGYDETITGPEDWDLPESIKKLGYKINRIKSKILHHERIPNLFSLVKKKYYYALKSHTYLRKQNISVFGPKTIYFLRPVFYKNWRKLVSNPILTIAMYIMFSFELVGGGLGYLVGKYLRK